VSGAHEDKFASPESAHGH